MVRRLLLVMAMWLRGYRFVVVVVVGGGIGSMMCRIGGRGVRTLCMWATFFGDVV